VLVFPLWYKILVTVIACVVPISITLLCVFGKSNNTMKDDISLLAFSGLLGCLLLLYAWTTRAKLSGNCLTVDSFFRLRRIDISAIRTISWSGWAAAYKIVDDQGRKVWLSDHLLGVENLIA